MRFELEVKFPCGYEVKIKAKALSISTDKLDYSECPLHGKECRRSEVKE
jgi:hypothetical protein